MAQSVQMQSLQGHVPAVVAGLQPVGRLPSTNVLHLAIALPLRNRDALANLVQRLYDPASPDYHHYLTPDQFTGRFGPSQEDYQALSNFANANGLTVTATHPNRTLLDVSGSVADVEKTFHVVLHVYQHPTEDRTFFAPDVEPSLDLTVPVLHIGGLDTYALPRPAWLKVNAANNGGNPNQLSGSGPSGNYMGYDFRAAYAPGVTLTGAGQNVGLLECDSFYPNDIRSYETDAGLPNVPLQKVLVGGFNGNPEDPDAVVEVSLDIEMAISMAPGLSNVMVYEASSDTPAYIYDIVNRMATDNQAKQLSSSWVIRNDAAMDQIYGEFAAQGQTFFQASGDEDAYTAETFQWEDDPYTTLVGGTILTTSGARGSWVSETVWNVGNGEGSGGGISTTYSIPTWQQSISMSSNGGSTTMRNIPDVALTADNVFVIANGESYDGVGGTSCAAPLWAGFIALVNQQAVGSGAPTVGFINPAIYAIGTGTGYTNAFHDITTGNNTWSESPTEYYAVPGYDLCTGWGTPAGTNLINALLPGPAINVTLPASATEGAGVLAGAGSVQLRFATLTNLVVTLISSDPAVLVPVSVTVLAGQSNAAFNLTLIDDGILDGTRTGTITASVPGYGSFDGSMTVFDIETATLQVSLPAATKGQGAVQGTVQVSAVVGGNVTVSLSSTDTNLIELPTSVVVASGQTSAAFVATVGNDGQITGPETVTVTAHVQNWTDGVTAVVVSDDLDLSVTLPEDVSASPGVLTNAGLVAIAGTLTTNLTVSLASSLPGTLTVPAAVTIVAGQLYNEFNLTLISNGVPSTNQTVTVTASAPGFTAGSASVQVVPGSVQGIPTNPAPGNLATNVPANTNLSWNFWGGNLIQNGGFETGTFTNWTQVSNITYNGHFVINNGTYKPYSPDPASPPYAGNYDAVGDEEGQGTFYMYQDVSIPSGVASATLNWAQRVRNFYTSFSSVQQYQVRICNTNNTVLAVAFSTEPGQTLLGNWVQTNYNMTSFAGRKVRVMFWVYCEEYFLDVDLDNISLLTGPTGGSIINEVYFGVNPAPGPAEFQGRTTNNSWTLPLLAPATTYFWQIVALSSGSALSGPVWQFTTAGVDHFAWSAIPSPQYLNQPFSATITAQDPFNSTVSNFTGDVLLTATAGPPASSNSVAITPANSASFVNGAWTGNITALQYATNVYLQANDGNGHVGQCAPFDADSLAPLILVQPVNQTLLAGATATFAVTATGLPPLSYQWSDNETNIPNATNASLTLADVQVCNDGVYAVTVSNQFGVTTSSNAVLAMAYAPSITIQPQSQEVNQGTNVSFTVGVNGTGPFNYQWSFGSVALPQGTNSTLTLTNVQWANNGSYSVVVSSPFGAVLSSNAVLTVDLLPIILAQPQSQNVPVGTNVTFSVIAVGTYSALPVINSGTLQLWLKADTGVVTNSAGLVSQWQDQSGNANDAAQANTNLQPTLVSTAGLGSGWVVWFNGIQNNINGSYLFGDGTVDVPNAMTDFTVYDAFSATNNENTIWDIGVPDVSGGNRVDMITAGDMRFSFWAYDYSVPFIVPTNTCRLRTDRLDTNLDTLDMFDTTADSATNFTMSVTGGITPGAGYYLGGLNSSIGPGVGSSRNFDGDIAELIVYSGYLSEVDRLAVTSYLEQKYFQGGAAGSLSYQWQFDGTNIANATNASLTLTNVQITNDGVYTVAVSNQVGVTISSNAVLAVGYPPLITAQPQNVVVTVGSNAIFSITAEGSYPLGYQWLFDGTNLTDSAQITGSQSNILTLTSVLMSNAGIYEVVVTNFFGSTNASATLTVIQATSVITWANPAPITFGTALNSSQLNATANVPGSFAYTPPNGTVLNVGTNTLSVIFTPNDTIDYSSATDTVSLVVFPATPIITWTNPAPITYGKALGSNQLNATANAPGSFAYTPPSGTVLNVGTNTLSVIFTPTDTVDYTSATDTVSLLVGFPPTITAEPTNQTVVQGSNALFSVTASGTSPLSYQWQFNGTNLVNATNSVLSIIKAQATNTGSYSVIVGNLFGSVTSAVVTLTVYGNLVLNGGFETGNFTSWSLSGGDPGDSLVDNGSYSGIIPHSGKYVAALESIGSLSYLSQTLATTTGTTYLLSLWLNSPDGLTPNELLVSWNGNNLFDETNIPAIGWTNLHFLVSAAGTSTVLEFGFRDDPSYLGLDDISVMAVPPGIASQPQNVVVVAGSNAIFSVTAEGMNPLGYQWLFDGTNLTDNTQITGSQSNVLTLSSVTMANEGTYEVVVTNAYGSTNASATLTVEQATPTITWSNPAPIPYGTPLGSNQLNATANVPGSFAYNPTGGTVLNAGTNTLSVIFTPTDTVDYSSATDTVNLVVGFAPTIIAEPTNQTVVLGSNALFSVTASGTSPLSYQWQFNGTNLVNATNSVLSIIKAQAANTGSYSVIVGNLFGSVTSAVVTLTVYGNLVLNGGFETGNFTSWSLSGGDPGDSLVDNGSYSGILPHSGSYVAALESIGSLSYLSQTLATTAGTAYLLSLWLDSPDGLTPNEFLVSWNGNTLFDETNIPAIGWTNLHFLVSAAGTSTVLEFGFRDDPSYLGLDDISVVAAQPATLPGIAGISLSGTNLVINGCNGFSGTTYYVLMSTNVALPLNQWTPVATNVLNTSGNFSITATNAVNLNVPQCFYILQMQ
jgi:subtilase family serine protease